MPSTPQLLTLAQSVGHTQLVRLKTAGADVTLMAKREAANPGGSIKDRVARALIDGAFAAGKLPNAAGLVEPTSGNTGVGLAMICASLGIELTLTMPESMSQERRALLKALGATLALTPAALGMQGAIDEARRLEREEGRLLLDQFTNPLTVQAHQLTTGPELLAQAGTLDVFVAAVGTGGTLMGVGTFLREHLPHIRLYAVEPAESPVLSGGKAGPHAIQGIGAGFVPPLLDLALLDGVITVTGAEAMACARHLAAHEGLLSGISSGANVHAALSLARNPAFKGARIATVLPDSGERYLSTNLFA